MSNKKEKFVESLRDTLKGKHIWIIGTGKSLDDFPKNFFDNKYTIALNGAMFKYPNCTFWHGHHEIWREYLIAEKIDILNKAIIPYPMPGPFYNNTPRTPEEFFGKLTSIPYWLYFLDSTLLSKEETRQPFVEIASGKKEKINFRCAQTVVHMAIQIAFLMGAKKITLVGCENKQFGKLPTHADIGIPYPWGAWDEKPLVDKVTKWHEEILSEYGVTLRKYYNKKTEYYKKGYEKI